jgi:hypothetical protein
LNVIPSINEPKIPARLATLEDFKDYIEFKGADDDDLFASPKRIRGFGATSGWGEEILAATIGTITWADGTTTAEALFKPEGKLGTS